MNEDFKKYPNSLNIFITERCNLNCRYCFVKKEAKTSKLNFYSLKRAIDLLLSFPGNIKTFSFNGGEPLLEFSLIKKTIVYALKKTKEKNQHLNIAVMTNGTLLSKKIVNFLVKHGVIVKISIDGKKEIHDSQRPFLKTPSKSSFETILKNLKNFPPSYPYLCASLVFTPESVHFLFENIKFLYDLGFPYVEFYPDMYAFWSKEDLKTLEREWEKIRQDYVFYFSLGKNTFKNSLFHSIINKTEVTGTLSPYCRKIHLAPDGNFYACDKAFSLPLPFRRSFIIGNAKEGIDNEKRLKILKKINSKVFQILGKYCTRCYFREFCFCPIGHYIYFSFKKFNLSKWLDNFCALSKIYIRNIFEIKERLKFNPLFTKVYSF